MAHHHRDFLLIPAKGMSEPWYGHSSSKEQRVSLQDGWGQPVTKTLPFSYARLIGYLANNDTDYQLAPNFTLLC